MTRPLIILTVVLLHIALLLWLVRGCGFTDDDYLASDTPRTDNRMDNTSQGQQEHSPTGTPEEREYRAQNGRVADNRFPADIYRPADLRKPGGSLPSELQSYEKNSRTGILLDLSSNRILWSKDHDRAVPIASMAKMMTVLLLMESIYEDADLTLDTIVPVTRSAAAVGGRQVWLDPRESFSLDELLKSTMIRSANDTAFLIAEYLADGNIQEFIKRMNQRAAQLGFPTAEFGSPHGLPQPGARTDKASALEMAYLAAVLLNYPEVTKWSATRLESIRDDCPQFSSVQLVNTNTLVERVPGVNGMKTGYTADAGFCLAATSERDGRVLVAVITGFRTANARDEFMTKLLDWGYKQ